MRCLDERAHQRFLLGGPVIRQFRTDLIQMNGAVYKVKIYMVMRVNRWPGEWFLRSLCRIDADARVVADGEHVVDDLEALVAGRVVDSGDVADLCEFGGGVVFEEGEDGDDAVGRDVDLEGLSV